jgi:sarcosine oxidase
VAAYEVGRFPLWIWDRDDGTAPYGVPAMAGAHGGVKASVHWSSQKPADAWTVAEVAAILDELLPGMPAQHLRSVDCTYTLTPDEHFVVGRHPASRAVLMACGFSGHGFKFTPVLGEVLADLAMGAEPSYDLAMFDPGRFARSPA